MRPMYCRALLSIALVLAGGPVVASTFSATDLGQSWPNAADVSASPHYHVYVFERGGIRYVQINDTNGTVRGAVAFAGGEAIDLPVGVDANRWMSATAGTSSVDGERVYADDAAAIRVAAQPDGTARLMLVPECDDPSKCSIRGP